MICIVVKVFLRNRDNEPKVEEHFKHSNSKHKMTDQFKLQEVTAVAFIRLRIFTLYLTLTLKFFNLFVAQHVSRSVQSVCGVNFWVLTVSAWSKYYQLV